MPKKATSNQAEDKQVSEAAFLKAFDKKKAAAKAAAKVERAAFLDDSAIMEKLGLKANDRQTFHGAVSKITFSFAKNDSNRPMFRFAYVLVSDDKAANGLIVSNNHIVEESKDKESGEVWRTEEEALENLFGEFQGLGEDTTSWDDPLKASVAAAKKHTADKTPISITLHHYVSRKGTHGLGVKVNGPLGDDDNSDLEDSDDTSSEESSDEFNPDDYLGGFVEFDNDDYGHIRIQVTSYDAENHTFSGTDSEGQAWEGDYAPNADSVEWSEDQTEFDS